MEVVNGILGGPQNPLTRVSVCPIGDTGFPEWEAVLGVPAAGVVANNDIIAVACEDATLHLMETKNGNYKNIGAL